MKEHSMSFRSDMVAALLAGTKTQTRRLIDPQPKGFPGWWPKDDVLPNGKWVGQTWHWASEKHFRKGIVDHCPWQVGDRIWVQEPWINCDLDGRPMPQNGAAYREDKIVYTDLPEEIVAAAGRAFGWRMAKTMPRWASRITLEVTEIRAQRIQEISVQDARAEGTKPVCYGCFETLSELRCEICGPEINPNYRLGFQRYWRFLYGEDAWERNEWVWVPSFKILEVKGRAA